MVLMLLPPPPPQPSDMVFRCDGKEILEEFEKGRWWRIWIVFESVSSWLYSLKRNRFIIMYVTKR